MKMVVSTAPAIGNRTAWGISWSALDDEMVIDATNMYQVSEVDIVLYDKENLFK